MTKGASGKKYVGEKVKNLNDVARSILEGNPAIVYTNYYRKHIFVLTSYNSSTQQFDANDTFYYDKKKKTEPRNVTQLRSGGKLTKASVEKHLKAQTRNINAICVKPTKT